jgi:hypothetical protein
MGGTESDLKLASPLLREPGAGLPDRLRIYAVA